MEIKIMPECLNNLDMAKRMYGAYSPQYLACMKSFQKLVHLAENKPKRNRSKK